MITTLEEAMDRIEELEKEVVELKKEIEILKSRNFGGRKKHNEEWQASYSDFVIELESGKGIIEIVREGNISRSTAYRYKAYYDKLKSLLQKETDNDNPEGNE